MSGLIRYLPRKLAYQRRLRRSAVRRPAADAVAYLRTLRRDGIVIIPDFLSREILLKMISAIPDRSQFEESPEGDRALFYPDADRVPELAAFFTNPLIESIAKAYISTGAMPFRRTVGLKVVHGDVLSFEAFPHMDTWKKRVKAFLYLEDVGADNGPMIYLMGSHRGLWRLPIEAGIAREYRIDDNGFALPEQHFVGCVWPHEAHALAATNGFRELVCTGPAGTLVMFDGRGLHRATALRAGHRLILASYWVHRGDHT